jgi:hypothetical protein
MRVAITLALPIVAACGGEPTAAPMLDAGCHAEPPPRPSTPEATGAVTPLAYAIRSVDFGDTIAWQELGFDVDGKDTTATSTDVCQLFAGAPPSAQDDGSCGIDDSFGNNLLRVWDVLGDGGGLSSFVTSSILAGGATDLLVLDRSNAASPSAVLYNGAALGHPPRWDGTDVWPIDATSVAAGGGAQLAFPNGYVNGGVWVGEPPSSAGAFTMGPFPKSTAAFHVPVAQVQILLFLSDNGDVHGLFSGVIPASAFADAVELYAQANTEALCESGYPSALYQLLQSADILLDGTQNPKMPCDGISVGFAFSASPVVLGAVEAAPEMGNPCVADAGAD